jgi:hypothetical protein
LIRSALIKFADRGGLMKLYYLLFLLVIAGIIFIVANPRDELPQAQEEAPRIEEISNNTFRIKIDIQGSEGNISPDILWFQKAAELAHEKKIPWFNVVEQSISTTSIEGIIKLERDPMKAEYDANEILSLELSDEVAE